MGDHVSQCRGFIYCIFFYKFDWILELFRRCGIFVFHFISDPDTQLRSMSKWWLVRSKWWLARSKWWLARSKWWLIRSKWLLVLSKWWLARSKWWYGVNDGWYWVNNGWHGVNDGWHGVNDDWHGVSDGCFRFWNCCDRVVLFVFMLLFAYTVIPVKTKHSWDQFVCSE